MDLDLERLRGRRLVGYGAGLATLLTLRETPLDLEFIVDDNPKSQGGELLGIPIVAPGELARVDPADTSVVIFAYAGSAIRVIQDKLAALGLGFPDQWIDCSLLHFHSYRRRLAAVLGLEVFSRALRDGTPALDLQPPAESERLRGDLAVSGAPAASERDRRGGRDRGGRRLRRRKRVLQPHRRP